LEGKKKRRKRKSDLPRESDVEEMARASLASARPDEMSAARKGEGPEGGPSYIVAKSKDGASADKAEDEPGEPGFWRTKFVGRTCVLMIFLW
jgi:hypothetical protein